MDNLLLWLFLGTLCIAVCFSFLWGYLANKRLMSAEADLRRIIKWADIKDKRLLELDREVEYLLSTPAEREARRYNKLPTFTFDELSSFASGNIYSLLIFCRGKDEPPFLYPIDYRHKELIYRSPNKKDPVAFGEARLDKSADFMEVRILYLRPDEVALLRGLEIEGKAMEGYVKEATLESLPSIGPRESL